MSPEASIMRRAVFALSAVSLAVLAWPLPLRSEVTAEKVNEAIRTGVAYLEKQQNPGGQWLEVNEPRERGGLSAPCTL